MATEIEADQVWTRINAAGQREVFTVEGVGSVASSGRLAIVGEPGEQDSHILNAGLRNGWKLATGAELDDE